MRALFIASALLIPLAAAQAQQSAPPAPAAAPVPPPSAVPGARVTPGAAPRQGTAELRPNEALFDAINRGDIGDARSAINRGAQLDAHNILGLTPLELAIDLGHNDISFLLLSMRQGGGDRTTTVRDEPQPRTSRRAPLAAPPVARASQPAPTTPRLWENNGGAAQPNNGFLGFDANRPAGRPDRSTTN